MPIKDFAQAKSFIYKHIDADPKKRFAGEFGLRRAVYFLQLLGNPQEKLKIVHIAGTTGKGSTAFYLSQLLFSQGFKVSLTLSPHLVDIRERCQINNRMIPKDRFVNALNRLLPAIERMEYSAFGSPSYFEILTALFFSVSIKEKVDYAIVETGLGGLYDGTNVVSRKDKLCLVTRIGLDHTEILGKTIEEIAVQKAGIIGSCNTVVKIRQEKEIDSVFTKKAVDQGGKIIFLDRGINYSNIRQKKDGLTYDFLFDDFRQKITLPSLGIFQAENSGLALLTLVVLSKRDGFAIDKKSVLGCLSKVNFSGRMEIFRIGRKKLIVDGAHNPQKMAGLAESLVKNRLEKAIFVIAFRNGKDYPKMLDILVPLASRMILTGFATKDMDLVHRSEDTEKIAAYLKEKKFLSWQIEPDARSALTLALKGKGKTVVVTGSLYLLSAIYPAIK